MSSHNEEKLPLRVDTAKPIRIDFFSEKHHFPSHPSPLSLPSPAIKTEPPVTPPMVPQSIKSRMLKWEEDYVPTQPRVHPPMHYPQSPYPELSSELYWNADDYEGEDDGVVAEEVKGEAEDGGEDTNSDLLPVWFLLVADIMILWVVYLGVSTVNSLVS